jgi:uncharacterized protein
VLRELWWGKIWFAMPVTVVADTDELVAIYVPPGTEGRGAVRPPGKRDNFATLATREWKLGPRTWERTRRLGLSRPDEPYVVSGFWNGDGSEFLHWYVDMVEPLRRTAVGFDFRDLELDVVIDEDLTWRWKDEEEVDLAIELGVFTSAEAAEIRAAGERVIEMVERGDAWWTSWRDWAPDPSWPAPTLPDGWDAR